MDFFFNGITTFVAVSGLIFSLFESSRDRKIRTQESLKEQAKKVACWSKTVTPKSTGKVFSNKDMYDVYIINNDSNLPIYNVFLFSVFNKDKDSINNIESAISSMDYSYYEVLAPGKLDSEPITKNCSAGGGHLVPCLTFNDASGNAWFRNKSGKLEPIKNYEVRLAELGLSKPY